jgi:serine/threonine protein phosphatase 1
MVWLRELFAKVGHVPSLAAGERIYAVGDLHGRLDLLRDLLGHVNHDIEMRAPCRTRLVLLGDMIDRGPFSREVLLAVRRLQERTGRVIALCGNHEEMLLQSAAGNGTLQQVWFDNGGDATLSSYGLEPVDFMRLVAVVRGRVLTRWLGSETLGWLASLPTSYRSGDYFFCHAGVRPGIPLSEQRREDLLWIRNEFLVSRRRHGAVVVHGHSEAYEVEVKRNRINVDTAAYLFDELTAVGLEGQERWFLSTLRGGGAERGQGLLKHRATMAAAGRNSGTGD